MSAREEYTPSMDDLREGYASDWVGGRGWVYSPERGTAFDRAIAARIARGKGLK